MKRFPIIIAASLLAAATFAWAAPHCACQSKAPFRTKGLYMMGLGGLAQQYLTAGGYSYSKQTLGFGGEIGYLFNSYIGLNMGFVTLPRFRVPILIDGIPLGNLEVKYFTTFGGFQFRLPLKNPRYSLFVNIGMGSTHADLPEVNAGDYKVDVAQNGLYTGVGMSYQFSKAFFIQTRFGYLPTKNYKLRMYLFGLGYIFS